jgi:glycosyltransferase involved in cell wall biosynthesis
MIEQHKPSAVITTSPPGVVHLLGRRIQKHYGLPWVACFRDPWIVNSFSTPPWWTPVYRSFESRVMARADQLVANTPGNLKGWSAAYPAAAPRMVTITNGFDPENFVRVADHGPPGQRVRILHAGELYAGRDPRPFLAALGQLNAEGSPIEAEFLGRNTEHAFNFAAEVRQLGLDAVVSTPGQVPYDVSLGKMQRADILLLFQRTGYNLGIPAKLYEYLGAGRAILAISEPDSDIAWVLRESKVLHRIAAPTDVPGIRRALTELISEVRAGRPAVPDPEALAQFTRERMAQRFADCLDRLTPA